MEKQITFTAPAVRAGLRAGCSYHIAPGWETDSKSECEDICREDNRCRSMGGFGNEFDLPYDQMMAYRNNLALCKEYWCSNKQKA